ncbi:MAG: hypothetical protein HFJ17_04325 [Clostridia bacterium]|nr:hypothetical protein [Clostridia bacterium]
MDNNELDKILKEKLKGKMQPSIEFEGKIRQKVEEEKAKKLKEMNVPGQNKKNNAFKKLRPILSMAAVILIVFAIGMNLEKSPIDLNLNKGENASVVTIKAIEPTKAENGIVAKDSDFIIYTNGEKTSKEDIQRSIYVEPALDYTIEKVNNEKYKLKFKQNIPDNTIVKLQYIKNKIAEDSWAYQTSNKLSVTSTYPDNDTKTVSENSVIEIKFSYASVESLEKNVKITPDVKGKWEHLGNVWRFKPNKGSLKEDQEYTVKINKGIKAENQTLENDYIFRFTVVKEDDGEAKYSYNTISMDGISTYKSNEQVKIYYNYNSNSSSKIKMSKIEIRKFGTVDDFIEYIQTKDYKKSRTGGECKFLQHEKFLQLDRTLQNGYYVAIIKSAKGSEIFNCPIQVNDLSAYAIETERDVLVWVADGEKLTKDVKVEYQGKETKTNNKGIATLKGIADNSKTIKYLKVGNNDNKLVVGLFNYELNNYPSAYLYTDRPLYKNTDTINIWGFVPRELFYDKIEDEFYIELDGEQKHKVNVDEEGNINYKIELKNHTDMEYTRVNLYYKDKMIACRDFTIQNYELQNYTYNVIMDKNYAYSGDKFSFAVKVEHITGLAVPNKTVAIKYNDKIYKKVTDEEGIAKFEVKVKVEDDMKTSPNGQEIEIFNGDALEYTDSENYIDIYVLNRDTYTDINEEISKKFKLSLYQLSKDKKDTVTYDLHEIYDGVYNTDVQINLVEKVSERYISDYTYNEYTKKDEPEYSYQETDNNTKHITTVRTQDGKLEFNANTLNLKQDTEERLYSYNLEFIYKDRQGRKIKEESYIAYEDEYTSKTLGFYWDYSSSGDQLGYIPSNIEYNNYYTYRYLLKKDKDMFSIGDTVNLKLAESTENGIKDIQNQGKILRIVSKEEINKTDIFEDNNLNYTFGKDDFPGCKIASAYFYNGKFYRMPTYYFDFNEEDRKVDVEINADKEQYKPGDKVTLTVKTTNKGNPIKSSVNVSVINKAVFELREDNTNILEELYTDKNYPIYTYSSYRDYINVLDGRRRRWRRRRKRKLWRHSIL